MVRVAAVAPLFCTKLLAPPSEATELEKPARSSVPPNTENADPGANAVAEPAFKVPALMVVVPV